MVKRKWLILSAIFFFIVGVSASSILQKVFTQNQDTTYTPTIPKKCPFQWINPLRCEPATAPKKKEYTTLKNDLLDFIQQEKQQGILTNASVYFRDLENGPIMDIDATEDFAPASLLKVPLLITYLKKAQDDPTLLERKISYREDIPNMKTLPQQNITPEQSAEKGKTYTINQLLTLLISQSDNVSWELLLTDLRKNYSEDDFIATLSDLGIIDPRKSTNGQYVTVQSYASIFRILYNSSYLNATMSDKVLELLTKADFNNGIVVGVPQGIKIAHKFGERKAGVEQQLHDCGIVYYTPNPYLLCIMTRGDNLQDLEPVIQKISKDVYEEVASRN